MTLEAARTRLQGRCAAVRHDEPLARHTTYGIGGPAALYVECSSVEELRHACTVFGEEHVEHVVLGKGSNVLAADAGLDGAVIVLGSGFRHMNVDGTRIDAGAGCVLAHVVQEAFGRGLSGLEFAVGIPGTLGGALAMNAGSRDVWIGSLVSSITILDRAGELKHLRGDEIAWGYRRSSAATQGIIVEASITLQEDDEERVRRVMESNLRRRRQTQPLRQRNAGSVFVNPPGDSAGRLIEECGLKGHRVGGAQVSELHANFIVNVGGATADDVVALVVHIREVVRAKHGIELTPEIRFVGRFEPA